MEWCRHYRLCVLNYLQVRQRGRAPITIVVQQDGTIHCSRLAIRKNGMLRNVYLSNIFQHIFDNCQYFSKTLSIVMLKYERVIQMQQAKKIKLFRFN